MTPGLAVARIRSSFRRGPVAQLGARLNGIQEVTGSIPVRSTNSLISFGRWPTLTVLRHAATRLRLVASGHDPGQVHHTFIPAHNRPQVAERRCGYGGSNKAFSVERDSCWKEQVALDLLASSIDHDEWFRAEVEKGRAVAREGTLLDHDDIAARMNRPHRD